MRQPQAAECRAGGEGAEDHRARKARLQQLTFPGPPCHDEINVERNPDAEQQRQCDDVLEVERQSDGDTDTQRGETRQRERRERPQHVGPAAQRDREQQGDRKERPQAGLQERADDGVARFLDRDRRARRFGSKRPDCADKAPQRFVVVRIALRKHFDSRASVGRDPVALEIVGQCHERHGPGLHRGAQLAERYHQPRDERGTRAFALRALALRERAHRAPQARRSGGGRALRMRSRSVHERLRGACHRAHGFVVARRRLGRARIQDGLEQQPRVVEQRQFLLLPFRHEARKRNHVIDFGQRLQPLRERCGFGHRGRQHVDRIRGRVRILHQIEQRRHGFDFGATQVQRIEVELQPRQQGQAAGRDEARDDEHRAPVPHEKPVERGERDIPHGGAFAGRTQQREQRRQQRDAGNERHDHPGAGDHAQLRYAAILGRHERIEARSRRSGGKRQCATDLCTRIA